MPKYEISFTEEEWYKVTIEADSATQAMGMFWSHDFNMEDVVHTGTEIQESIDIKQKEDE
jgi:hypothetical protein